MKLWNVPFTTIRTVVLFIAGLAGIAHQTLVAAHESPTLLVLFGAMIGLPAFLNKDESDVAKKSAASPAQPPPTSSPPDEGGQT